MLLYEHPSHRMGVSLEDYRHKIGCFLNFVSNNSETKMDKQRSHYLDTRLLFTMLLGIVVASIAITHTSVPQDKIWYLTNNGAHAYCGNTATLCGDFSRGIKLVQWNIRSLCPTGSNTKLDQLRLLLREPDRECHILGITESWLNNSYDNKDLMIQGFYPPERFDRSDRSGGGVAVYILSRYNFIRRSDIETQDVESVWVEIKLKNQKPIIICTVYRPPDTNIDQWITKFERELDIAYSGDSQIVVMGDLNINLNVPNDEKDKLCTCLGQYDMHQIIADCTRCTPHSETLIDHVWSTSPEKITEWKVPKYGLSDHFPTCAVISSKWAASKDHMTIKYRSFKNFDSQSFTEELGCLPWSVLEVFEDPNDYLDAWTELFMSVLDRHAPTREKRVKRKWQPGWLTNNILESMKQRDYFKRKKDDASYKLWRNRVVSEIRNAKQEYYRTLIETNNNDARKIWEYMRELNPKPTTTLPSSLQSGSVADKDIADEFNAFFTDIVERFIPTNDSDYDRAILDRYVESKIDENSQFDIPKLTVTRTEALLRSLSANKAKGLDDIPPKVLKIAASQIAPSVCRLINLCLETGIFPREWKRAKVTPIYKAGPVDDPGNYRPVSVLSALSKIAEKHIYKHLYAHLQPMLYNAQSGFRQSFSCETALTRLLDMWTRNMDDNKLNGVVLLDLRKAFDLISHKTLMIKLQQYKIGPSSLKLFDSYLVDRVQQVAFKGSTSSALTVKSGVPQGSILGPLFFILYINDLPLQLGHSTIDMYADDSTVTVAGNTVSLIEDTLNNELEIVSDWCTQNKMALNIDKTKSMLITTSRKRLHLGEELKVTVNGQELENVQHEKLLGVVIDNDLTFKHHVDKVCGKVSRATALLRRIKHYLNTDTRRKFYMAYIQPHVDYCITIWGPSSHTPRVRKLQNIAMRVMADEPRMSSSAPIFRKFAAMPVNDRLDYKMTSLTHKAVLGHAPTYLNEMFQKVSDFHSRQTRSSVSGKLVVPKARLSLRRNGLAYKGATLFNNCPSNIRVAQSSEEFKLLYYQSYFSA